MVSVLVAADRLPTLDPVVDQTDARNAKSRSALGVSDRSAKRSLGKTGDFTLDRIVLIAQRFAPIA